MSKEEQNHPAFQYGTNKQFLNWASYQPSVIDGDYNQYEDNEGNPRNISCHVRRLKFGSGMADKPPFSAVPMTDAQHKIQSGKDGEQRVLKKYKNLILTKEEAAEWFENAAKETLKNWINHQLQKRK